MVHAEYTSMEVRWLSMFYIKQTLVMRLHLRYIQCLWNLIFMFAYFFVLYFQQTRKLLQKGLIIVMIIKNFLFNLWLVWPINELIEILANPKAMYRSLKKKVEIGFDWMSPLAFYSPLNELRWLQLRQIWFRF